MDSPLVDQLEQLRLRARLAQRHAATIAGVSSREYTNWLTEQRRPAFYRVDRVQAAIDQLNEDLRASRLPIHGHGRGSDTARKRDAYTRYAVAQIQNRV